MYKAKFSFDSLATGERVTREFETEDNTSFIFWINKYLTMDAGLEKVNFSIDMFSDAVYTDFKIPKKLRRYISQCP